MNPVLEAFGNSRTIRNDNSSRFGRFTNVSFGEDGSITGASITTYLLEKSRVVVHARGERNYHIFYQMTEGVDDALLAELRLSRDPGAFHYLRQGEAARAEGDRADFERTRAGFEQLGVGAQALGQVLRVLAGVLHLGNVAFENEDTPAGPQAVVLEGEALGHAAFFLGVPAGRLSQSLTSRVVQVQARRSAYTLPLSAQEAEYARDSVAKLVYSRLFDWVVRTANAGIAGKQPATGGGKAAPAPAKAVKQQPSVGRGSLRSEGGSSGASGGGGGGGGRPAAGSLPTLPPELLQNRRISILDIYGFECFPVNRFEQLCINYANETLQQLFLAHHFKDEEAEHLREGIPWHPVAFADNAECVELLTGKVGVLRLVDEECALPKGSDESMTAKLHQTHGVRPGGAPGAGNRHYIVPRINQSAAFGIQHFAGAVEYSTAGFLDKNKDTVQDAHSVLLAESSSDFLREVLDDRPAGGSTRASLTTAGGRPAAGPGAGRVTVLSAFRESLQALKQSIAATEQRFIRCIKPNALKQAGLFDEAVVATQLTHAGIVATIQVASQFRYPKRLALSQLPEVLDPLGQAPLGEPVTKERLQRALAEAGLRGDPAEAFAVGKTKVFFSTAALLALMDRSKAVRARAIVRVQAQARSWAAKRALAKLREEVRLRKLEEERLRKLEEERLRKLEEERLRKLEEERLRRLEEEERLRKLEEERVRKLEEERVRKLEDEERLRKLEEEERLRKLEEERLRKLEEEERLRKLEEEERLRKLEEEERLRKLEEQERLQKLEEERRAREAAEAAEAADELAEVQRLLALEQARSEERASTGVTLELPPVPAPPSVAPPPVPPPPSVAPPPVPQPVKKSASTLAVPSPLGRRRSSASGTGQSSLPLPGSPVKRQPSFAAQPAVTPPARLTVVERNSVFDKVVRSSIALPGGAAQPGHLQQAKAGPGGEHRTATVTFAFAATDPSELSLSVGASVVVIAQDPSGWWLGTTSGRTGIFPGNHVTLAPPSSSPSPSSSASTNPASPGPGSSRLKPVPGVVQAPPRASSAVRDTMHQTVRTQKGAGGAAAVALAIAAFAPLEEGELGLTPGDEVDVLLQDSSGWWLGRKRGGGAEMGLFPGNHCVIKSVPAPKPAAASLFPDPPPEAREGAASRTKSSLFRKVAADEVEEAKKRKRAEQRQRVIAEILSTEQSYVDKLRLLSKFYVKPLKLFSGTNPESVLQNDQWYHLFCNLDSIVAVNEDLLARLAARAPEASLGDIFVAVAPHLNHYSVYVNNYNNAQIVLDMCRSGKLPRLAQVLADIALSKPLEGLDLASFLIMPIQRIPRYELLLREVIKNTEPDHPDRPSLERAIAEINKLASKVNDKKAEHERIHKVLEIQAMFSAKPEFEPFVAPHRRFVREGALIKKPAADKEKSTKKFFGGLGKDRERHFFLFNDLLVYASKSKLGKALYEFKGTIPLADAAVSSKPMDAQIGGSTQGFPFEIITTSGRFVMFAETPLIRDAWVKDINAVIAEIEKRQTNKF